MEQDEDWSLVLKVLEPANSTSREVIMQIKFLVDYAPHHVLASSNKFVFFDKAAEGIVINADEMPKRCDCSPQNFPLRNLQQ
ncbi:hypothetical protein ABEX47_23590 [Paenibacillus ehimensis]|uniref:hypothetical protein n=1 Tax=Paenibacillus ehimensis TaxID=79264 RepID=UPI003D281E9A